MTTVLIPGSFDPLHAGHVDIVEQSTELFGDVVVGVLYNHDKPSGLFTPDERVELAAASLADLPTVRVEKFGGLAVQAAAGVRPVFPPSRPGVGFVSSRFIREIAAHGGVVDHLVPKPVAVALADR